MGIADKIKNSSVEARKTFQRNGLDVFMLTGDNRQTAVAMAVAAQAGIPAYRAEVLPGGKADFVKSLQQKGYVVAMIGDSINDSQALALADVNIDLGKGSDIAMDVANMTIISPDLAKIPKGRYSSPNKRYAPLDRTCSGPLSTTVLLYP